MGKPDFQAKSLSAWPKEPDTESPQLGTAYIVKCHKAQLN